jgi:hypothetical protein
MSTAEITLPRPATWREAARGEARAATRDAARVSAAAAAAQAAAVTEAAARSPAPRGYVVALRPIEFFRASEEVDADHVHQLAEEVRRSGQWLAPLPVEAASGLVMDGNHRLQVARLLGLRRLPCVPLHYGDQRLRVRCWKTGRPFSLEELRDFVATADVLPYKTTRHAFDPPLPETEIPLSLLVDAPLGDAAA